MLSAVCPALKVMVALLEHVPFHDASIMMDLTMQMAEKPTLDPQFSGMDVSIPRKLSNTLVLELQVLQLQALSIV